MHAHTICDIKFEMQSLAMARDDESDQSIDLITNSFSTFNDSISR